MTKIIAILIAAFFAVTAVASDNASTAQKANTMNARANHKVLVQKNKKKRTRKAKKSKKSKKPAATPAAGQ